MKFNLLDRFTLFGYVSFITVNSLKQTQLLAYILAMQNLPLSVQQIYTLSRPQTLFSELEGYKAPKCQVNPARMIQQRQISKRQKGGKPRVNPTKRGSFLDDQIKLHKIVPGPGKYPLVSEWPEKAKLKARYSKRSTFIQDIFRKEKKEKRPAPGSYNLFKSLKQQQQEAQNHSARKRDAGDRLTYLDSVQFDAIANPGVGKYNIRRRSQTEMSFSKYKTKPEDWRKKHSESALTQHKKKKAPTATSYSPRPSDFSLFSTMGKSKRKNGFGRMARFKTSTSGSGINPAKYSLVQQWRGKNNKVDRHGLEVLYKGRGQTSVYHGLF